MLEISPAAATTAGIVLLTVVGIESGGYFLTRVVRGDVEATEFQKAFYRAGHAHAGVLVTLGLVTLLYAETTQLDGLWRWLGGTGVLVAAALMSGGFFAAAGGRGRTRPNRWIWILWAGAVFLAAGVVTLAVGLLTS